MFRVIHAMHIGPKAGQEDCLLVNGLVVQEEEGTVPVETIAQGGLFAVCDGMGGHERGEAASRFACERLAEHADDPPASPEAANHLLAAVQTAFAGEPLGEGGTTVAALALHEGRALAFSAGDSRIYRFAQGALQRLSHDHSLMQAMIDQGHLDPVNAREYRFRHVIEFGLGPAFAAAWRAGRHAPSVVCDGIAPGEAWLLCTDGVHDALDDAEIAAILAPLDASAMAALGARLLDVARDNWAVVLVTEGA